VTKILLAEDDRDTLDVTTYALRRQGYNVVAVCDGAQALQAWQSHRPDIVLLDVGLPNVGGFELSRRIRAESDTPVIMVTNRTDEDSVLRGFLAGADDYVTKPFSHRELGMRIKAVLARCENPLPEPPPQIRTRDLVLDSESHEVTPIGGAPVQLTPLEFRLLQILALNEGRVVTLNRLVEYAWGYDGGDPSMLKTHLSHVRTKLERGAGHSIDLRSLPSVGYSLGRRSTGS
jgi:DNA-binding response OmpR family regulator